jgi:hypothetical protein
MALHISRRDARREALTGLIDYAGLFPPASLDMETSISEYRDARSGPSSWMVDRFICPAWRLEELAGALTGSMTVDEVPWRVLVTADGDAIPAEATRVRDFEAEMSPGAEVDGVETRLPDPSDGGAATEALEAFGGQVFFEVPWSGPSGEHLDVLAAVRAESHRSLGAKIRCGGTVAEAFPPAEAVAEFVSGCVRRRLPFKATAGLHHPYRHLDEETGFTHHGFVNVLVASALAHGGEAAPTLVEVLSDGEASHFDLSASGLSWMGHRVGAADLGAMRTELFVGYGSCSFVEPVEDLTAIGVLPA